MFFIQDRNENRAKIQLQQQLKLAATWFAKCRLKMNSDKTVAVLFSCTKYKNTKRPTINNKEIDWSSNAKFRL